MDLVKIFTSGAFVNFVLVIIGGSIGLVFKKGIPERVRDTLMKGMALCVFFIGVSGFFEEGVNVLTVVLSMAIGGIIGELCNLDRLVNRLAQRFEGLFNKGGENTKFAEGLVSATLLFCVGAMTVVGSIDSGLSGDNTTLYSKSLIDCISASVLASAFGIGVPFAAFPVLFIEGLITVAAAVVAPVLTIETVNNMTAVGSLLIIAISFNMLDITKIKVMNFFPAIFLPVFLRFIL